MSTGKVGNLTPADEQALIVRAQDGDGIATIELLAAYRPYIGNVVKKYPGFDAEEFEAELVAQLWEAVKRFDPQTSERLWGTFSRTGVEAAVDAMTAQQYPVTVPARTADRARQVDRMVAAGATVEEAAAHHHMSVSTYQRLKEFGDTLTDEQVDEGQKDRYGRTRGAWTERTPDESVAQAEIARDAMTDLGKFLTDRKYGFERDENGDWITLPTHQVNTGRSNAEVADWYSEQPNGAKPLNPSGTGLMATRTVSEEVKAALSDGRTAIEQWIGGAE